MATAILLSVATDHISVNVHRAIRAVVVTDGSRSIQVHARTLYTGVPDDRSHRACAPEHPLDPSAYRLIERLDDGTPVTLRAIRRDDGPRIRRAFASLGPETVRARFFEHRADVSDAELRRLTHVDFKRDAALLLTIGAGNREMVIGGASYFALDDSDPPQSAELAFTIADGYQGRGLGRVLMRYIAGIARANGLTFLEADVLANNYPMLSVFEHSGLPLTLRRDRDMVHVTLALRKRNAFE